MVLLMLWGFCFVLCSLDMFYTVLQSSVCLFSFLSALNCSYLDPIYWSAFWGFSVYLYFNVTSSLWGVFRSKRSYRLIWFPLPVCEFDAVGGDHCVHFCLWAFACTLTSLSSNGRQHTVSIAMVCVPLGLSSMLCVTGPQWGEKKKTSQNGWEWNLSFSL